MPAHAPPADREVDHGAQGRGVLPPHGRQLGQRGLRVVVCLPQAGQQARQLAVAEPCLCTTVADGAQPAEAPETPAAAAGAQAVGPRVPVLPPRAGAAARGGEPQARARGPGTRPRGAAAAAGGGGSPRKGGAGGGGAGALGGW